VKKINNQCNEMMLKEVLYRENYIKVFKTIYSITHNKENAEDITQEAFYKAFNKLDSLKDQENFFTWVCRIAINILRDEYKKHLKENEYLNKNINVVNDKSHNFSAFDKVDEKTVFINNMKQLNRQDREIIYYYYLLDATIEEIASTYDITVNSVRVKLHRARNKLKKIFLKSKEQDVKEV